MSVVEVTMYRVQCDAEGCEVHADEGSETVAWTEPWMAEDQATDRNWYTAELDDRHLCPLHWPKWCDEHDERHECANRPSTSSDLPSSTGTKGDSPVGGVAAVKPVRLTDDGTTEAAP